VVQTFVNNNANESLDLLLPTNLMSSNSPSKASKPSPKPTFSTSPLPDNISNGHELNGFSSDLEKIINISRQDSEHDFNANDIDEDTLLLQRDQFKQKLREQQAKSNSTSNSSSSPGNHQSSTAPGSSKGLLLAIYSALCLITSVGNSIYFKKMINHMENHVYFLNQLTSSVFVPVFGVLVAYELYFTNYITKQMRAFPKRKFFVMGVFDAVCGILTMFGAVHTAGSTQALLTNSVIPVTMFLSYFILKQRFRVLQYIGASVIMAGIGVVLYPQLKTTFVHNNAESSTDIQAGGGEEAQPAADIPLFNFLFMLSVVPGALSSIYKELAFADADVDANYLQYWVAIWQFFFGFALAPLNSLSFLGPQSVPPRELISALSDGCWCLLGYNTKPGDDCAGSWVPLTVYLIFNLAFNMFSVLLIKHGSATLMFIIMTLRLPMVQWAFSIAWISSPPDHFAWTSGIGLIVILAGLIFYRWPSKATGKGEGDTDHYIMPGVFDNRSVYAALHREQQHKLKRSAHQIRSSLYSALGVIDSPPTPYSPGARKFSPKANSSRSPLISGNSSRSSYNSTDNRNISNLSLNAPHQPILPLKGNKGTKANLNNRPA
jgi:drug/metabolite transporter (DMT)-like permease